QNAVACQVLCTAKLQLIPGAVTAPEPRTTVRAWYAFAANSRKGRRNETNHLGSLCFGIHSVCTDRAATRQRRAEPGSAGIWSRSQSRLEHSSKNPRARVQDHGRGSRRNARRQVQLSSYAR